MRQLIFATIIIVIVGAVWLFYLQYSENKFQESLPKAPVLPAVSDTQEIKSPEIQPAPKVVQQETLDGLPVLDTNAEETKENLSTVEAYTRELYEGQTSELIEIPIELTGSDNTADSEQSKPWLKPIAEMTLSEITAEVKRRREALVNTFGDTPEVALINKYTTVESLRDGRVTLDGEDGLAYIQAIGVLWPGGQNNQILKDLQELQRNGWHASSKPEFQNLPGIE